MPDPKMIAGLLPQGWDHMNYQPFRDGVEICHLWQGGPDVAMLRYAPGASVPRHRHLGLETILVLSGTLSDQIST